MIEARGILSPLLFLDKDKGERRFETEYRRFDDAKRKV
jgi:hypothetical protein